MRRLWLWLRRPWPQLAAHRGKPDPEPWVVAGEPAERDIESQAFVEGLSGLNGPRSYKESKNPFLSLIHI